MIQHVVLWSFRPEVDKDNAFEKMKVIFAEMRERIPEMLKLELHKGFQGYDACLITHHKSRQDLEAYQNHPAHQPVKTYMHSIVENRASCDSED